MIWKLLRTLTKRSSCTPKPLLSLSSLSQCRTNFWSTRSAYRSTGLWRACLWLCSSKWTALTIRRRAWVEMFCKCLWPKNNRGVKQYTTIYNIWLIFMMVFKSSPAAFKGFIPRWFRSIFKRKKTKIPSVWCLGWEHPTITIRIMKNVSKSKKNKSRKWGCSQNSSHRWCK